METSSIGSREGLSQLLENLFLTLPIYDKNQAFTHAGDLNNIRFEKRLRKTF